MVRLGAVALILSSLPVPAAAAPPDGVKESAQGAAFHLPKPATRFGFASGAPIGKTQIAPNAHFGFGMFGLKSEKSPLQPATGREIDLPKQRRAAVGFSLRF